MRDEIAVRKTNARQAEIMKHLRVMWIIENGPCACGSWENLEVHHRDPSQKYSHRIWSYVEEKRKFELDKCKVLCRDCHKEEHRKLNTPEMLETGLVHEDMEFRDIPSKREKANGPKQRDSVHNENRDVTFERHYTVTELGNLLHLSDNTVRKIFENEPGVLRIESDRLLSKRKYVTLRIPESVVQTVHRENRTFNV